VALLDVRHVVVVDAPWIFSPSTTFLGSIHPVQLNEVLKSLSDDPSSSENGSAVAWKLTQQVDNGRMVSQTIPQNEDLPQHAVVSDR
jgi:hypothetical protein